MGNDGLIKNVVLLFMSVKQFLASSDLADDAFDSSAVIC